MPRPPLSAPRLAAGLALLVLLAPGGGAASAADEAAAAAGTGADPVAGPAAVPAGGVATVPAGGAAAGPAGGTGAKAETEAEADAPPIFVPIEGLQVPIIDAGEMGGRLRLEIVLQATSAAELPTVRRDLPLFRDRAFSAALEYARLHVSPYAAVNAAGLSAALDGALQDPALKRVLIVQVRAEPA